MRTTIYLRASVWMMSIICLTSCNKQVTFEQHDRLNIRKEFRLQEVRSENNELFERYTYDGQKRLKQVVYNGTDIFELSYDNGSDKVKSFNEYQASYDEQNRLTAVSGPELSNTQLKYLPNQIQIIQTTRMIVPGPKPTQIDTLNLFTDGNGTVVRATLLPKKIGYEFRYDQYANPYIHNEDTMLPILLVYPLQQVFKEIASLKTGRNLMRVYQNATNISNSVEKPLVEDISYRYDHIKYDVPTSSNSHGQLKSQRHFLYTE